MTNVPLTLAVIVPLPIGVLFMNMFRHQTRVRYHKQWRIDSKATSILHDIIKGIRVVKSFVREDYEIDKFEDANADLKNSGMRAVKVMIFMGPVMNFFMYASIIAIIWFGHNIVIDEKQYKVNDVEIVLLQKNQKMIEN